MHSYLVIGNQTNTQKQVDKLIRKLGATLFEFPLTKISHVRELNSFTAKTFAKKTAIVIKNIDSASPDALNAFLKNLEEPQENVCYILTAASSHNLLPTVVSRCQVINVKGREKLEEDRELMVEAFLQMDIAEKLLFVKKIKDRNEAKKFTNELTIKLHTLLVKNPEAEKTTKKLRAAQKISLRLEANTNLALQLGNLAISLV